MSRDQLKEERMKILELLSSGVISADDASNLLAALDNSDKDVNQEIVVNKKKAPFKMLKILVDSNDGDKVRIQIPVEFSKLRVLGKVGYMVETVLKHVDAILEMISQGVDGEIVNIVSADGDIVKIVVE